MEHDHGTEALAPSGAMAMTMWEPAGMRMLCNGTVIDRKFGSWQGHILPGVMFIVWGMWWAYGIFQRHYTSLLLRQRYTAEAWYEGPLHCLKFLEPALKVVLPIVGASIELWLDHDAYRYLYCPKDTQLGGKFAVEHLNNWQHASNYPAFVVCGIIDFLGMRVPLPQGTNSAFLVLAFGLEAFLMGVHGKHIEVDSVVHRLLFVAMLGVTVMLIAEMAYPHNLMVSTGKAFFLTVKGAWLCAAAVILFEDRPEWDPGYMGSAMVVPLAFAMVCLTIAVGLLAMYLVMRGCSTKTATGWPVYSQITDSDIEACDRDDSAHETCSDDDITVVRAQPKMTPFNLHHDVVIKRNA